MMVQHDPTTSPVDHNLPCTLHREMLTYIKTAVTRNASEKKINSLLDHVSNGSASLSLLQDFYTITLQALLDAKNERLWFKTNLKLCQLFSEQQEYGKAQRILRDLHKYAFCVGCI